MRHALLFCFFLVQVYGYSQSGKPKIAQQKTTVDSVYKVSWLKKHAIPVRTIDSSDEDFSDLMPFKKVIGDAQVIFLGESSHWAGPFYHAKTRLIKFLHQEMGFDVLAYESSIDGTATTWNIMKEGRDSRDAFKNSVTFGRERIELQPLHRYLEQKAGSEKPLELVGIDPQMSGRLSYDSTLSRLRRYFQSIGYAADILNDTSAFGRNFRGNSQLPRNPTPPSTKFNSTFDLLINVIDSLAPKPHSFETQFHKQVLKSVKRNIQGNSLFASELSGRDEKRLYTFTSNIRDEQMADNLLWYIKQYPNRKFIVSAHNTHLLTGFDPAYPAPYELDTVVDKHRLDAVQMGQIVKDSLGSKIYNIGFVGNRGAMGRIDLKDSTRNFIYKEIPSSKKDQLENLLFAAGFNYAFIDLKNTPKGGEWLKGRFPLRYYTGVNFSIEAVWHQLVDGIFYVRELTPSYIR